MTNTDTARTKHFKDLCFRAYPAGVCTVFSHALNLIVQNHCSASEMKFADITMCRHCESEAKPQLIQLLDQLLHHKLSTRTQCPVMLLRRRCFSLLRVISIEITTTQTQIYSRNKQRYYCHCGQQQKHQQQHAMSA